MWWTLVLTVTGIVGLWQIPKTWHGWIWYLANEWLWLVYGLAIHSMPLIVMSMIWAVVGCRNLAVARDLARQTDLPNVQSHLPLRARSRSAEAGGYLSAVLRRYRDPAVHFPINRVHSHNGIGPCGTDVADW